MALIENRYTLIKEVGLGGFATVYRAWDSTLQKFVAVKKIHDEYAKDAKFADMFRAEALNTAKLEHENIVRVINFIKDSNGHLYMIMDYVNGINLEIFIKKCKAQNVAIPFEFTGFILSSVLKALDYANNVKDEFTAEPLRLVHLDISPANIMLYFDGRVKLTDFGIAKAGETKKKKSKKGKIGGKLSYMSPEQARGETGLDIRSDLFSCGIILYEMLSGIKAYEGTTELDIIQKVTAANYDNALLKKAQISKAIQEIVKKSMNKVPDKRYQNPVEFFIAIKKELSKIGTTFEIKKKYDYFIQGFLKKEREKAFREREEDMRYGIKGKKAPASDKPAKPEKKAAAPPIGHPVLSPINTSEKIKKEESPDNTSEISEELSPDEISKTKPPADSNIDSDTSLSSSFEEVSEDNNNMDPEGTDIDVEEIKSQPEQNTMPSLDVPDAKEIETKENTETVSQEEPPEADMPTLDEISGEEEEQEILEKESAAGQDSSIEDESDIDTEKIAPETSSPNQVLIGSEENTPKNEESLSDQDGGLPWEEDSNTENPGDGIQKTSPNKYESKKISIKPDDITPEPKEEDLQEIMPVSAPHLSTSRRPRSAASSVPLEQMEGEKTVFDFVLDTAKKHMKILISAIITLILGGIIYSGVDTYMQLTPWGIKINNMIWPPAIKIDSLPSKAHIMLLDKNNEDIINKEGYQSLTPTYIKEIQPGAYTLKLNSEGYREIIRKVTVHGQFDDDRAISIARARKTGNTYVLPFEVDMEIKSVPAGAELYMDDLKIGVTPFKVSVEIGPRRLKLVKKGYETLGETTLGSTGQGGICVLDTSIPSERQTQVDKNYWTVLDAVVPGKGRKYVVKAKLWKNFSFNSSPQGVKVFINNAPEPIGETPINRYPLTAGTAHEIMYQKDGFENWSTQVFVDDDVEQQVKGELKKYLSLSSYHTGVSKKDINAKVKIKETGQTYTTPFRVALPLKKYTLTFSKEPKYRAVTIKHDLNKDQAGLNVGMKLKLPHLTMSVKDMKSGKKINAARVWINGSYWKRTNSKGVVYGYLNYPTGEIGLMIKAEGFPDYSTSLYIKKAQKTSLGVKLGYPNDGVIFIESGTGLGGISVYMDEKLIGKGSQWINNITRSRHILKLSGGGLRKDISTKIINEKEGFLRFYRIEKNNSSIELKEYDPVSEAGTDIEKLEALRKNIDIALKEMPTHQSLLNIQTKIGENLGEYEKGSDDLMAKAYSHILNEEYPEAVKIYQRVLKLDKDNMNARLKLEETQRLSEEYIKTKSQIKKIETKQDEDSQVAKLYSSGMTKFNNSEYMEALDIFSKGLNVINADGNDNEFKEQYREIIYETKIQISEQIFMQGENYVATDNFEKAKEKFKEALKYNPFNPKARNRLDDIRAQTIINNKDEADEYFTKGIDDNDALLLNKAIKIYSEILIVDADNISVRERLKEAKYKLQQLKNRKAEQKVTKKEKEVEAQVATYFNSGIKYFDSKKYSSALSQFRKGYNIVKKWDNDRWAEQLDKKISETKEKLAEKYFENGYMYYRQNNLEDALKEFQQAIAYNPGNNEAKSKIREIKDKLTDINSNKAEKLYTYGKDEYAAGNYKEAHALWQKVIELAPSHKEALKAIERVKEKLGN